MNKLILFLCVCLFSPLLSAQSVSPKREFRGAWLATVDNLDWPTRGASPASQQAALIVILDKLKSNGINAVIFQVRPECDALYPSAIEPWSRWLTSVQGQAPNPLWDPLQFAIDESHKRGMELHAWFNPYRAVKSVGSYAIAASHVTNTHPEWILTFPSTSLKILNPGLPQVRDYVASVCGDIVRRYAIDGIHADDYFYPYDPKISWEDTTTFRQNSRGFTNINDWRRDNVNLLMKAVMDSILVLRPNVKFGMSPFGIWKNGVPSGVGGMDNYNDLFADPVAWMQNKWVDYITPQLYWKFSGGQDYGALSSWWATVLNGRHLYTGNAPFHVSDGSFNATELPRQLRYNRTVPGIGGAIHFRANVGINDNPQGFADSLKNDIYKYPAIPPTVSWKDTVRPNAPSNLKIDATGGVITLTWDAPAPAADGDGALRYAVYRFKTAAPAPADRDDARNLIYLAGTPTAVPAARIDAGNVQYSFAVSALDKNNNESAGMTNLVSQPASVAAPTLASPVDNTPTMPAGVTLQWNTVPGVTLYQIEIASSASFAPGTVLYSLNTASTSFVLSGLLPQQQFYWRVTAGAQGGTSPYSSVRSFTTAWPSLPVLLAPQVSASLTRWPVFSWTKAGGTSFRFQLSTSADFTVLANMVIDTTVSDTTFYRSTPLDPVKQYRWRVMASNLYGQSEWTAALAFRTNGETAVERDPALPLTTELFQNYPNPFNPATKFKFTLSSTQHVRLSITDVLGRVVSVPISEMMSAGIYTVDWDASRLPSGTYFYSLQAGSYAATKKLLLQK